MSRHILIPDRLLMPPSLPEGDKYLVYGEGIYVGCRYYETRYEDAVMGKGNAGDYDYSSVVQFPFGYGLSYTDFTWSDYKVDEDHTKFEVEVKVTNSGDAAGKDVVEIYLQSPYTAYDMQNGIEKASVVLAGFARTGLLEPGASETVKITVSKELMKSYDSYGSGSCIVDAGDYYIAAGRNAHDALNNILAAKGYSAAQGIDTDGEAAMSWMTAVEDLDTETYAKSGATGAAVANRFSDADIRKYDNTYIYLSRHDWQGTWPVTYKDGSWQPPKVIL